MKWAWLAVPIDMALDQLLVLPVSQLVLPAGKPAYAPTAPPCQLTNALPPAPHPSSNRTCSLSREYRRALEITNEMEMKSLLPKYWWQLCGPRSGGC